MANSRERVVSFAVKARDEYSKVLKNLEQQQNRLSAAAKASGRREVLGVAKGELEAAVADYKRLASEVERYRAVQAAAAQTGKLSQSEMRELGDTIRLVRDRSREAMAAIQQKRAALLQLTPAAKSGYAAFDRMASAMQRGAVAATQESTAAASDATQLRKLETASKGAAAAQGTLKTKLDGATQSMDRQRKGGRNGAKGDAQDVEVWGLKPWQLTNLGYQVNDVVSGLAMGQAPLQILAQQAGQFAQIWPNVMVALARSVPIIAGVTAVLAPFVAAAMRMSDLAESQRIFARELALSADGARYNSIELAEAAQQMRQYGIDTENARKIVSQFVKDGISQKDFGPLAKMADQLNDITGEGIAEAAKRLSGAFSGTVNDVRKLDEELNFLTATQLESIRAMEKGGDRVGALGLAQSILNEKLANSVQQQSEWAQTVKAMTDAWNGLVEAIQNSGLIQMIGNDLAQFGTDLRGLIEDIEGYIRIIKKAAAGPTLDDKIAQTKREIADAESLNSGGIRSTMMGDELPALREKLRTLESIRDMHKAIEDAATQSTDAQGTTTVLTEEEKKVRGDIQVAIEKQLKDMRENAELAGLTNRELFVEKTLKEAINKAQEEANRLGKEYLGLTKEQTAAIREQAGAAYDRELGNKYSAGEGLSSFVDKVVGVESGGNASAKNSRSSATGLGQFITSTWMRMFKEYFPDRAKNMTDAAILLLREDSKMSRVMIEKYAQENAKVLQSAGKSVNDASLYLSHFLGPQGALKVLSATPTTAISDLLSKQTIDANPNLRGKTAGQVTEWAAKKMNLNPAEVAGNERLVELDKERADKQEKYNKDYKQRITDQQFELDLMTKGARQAAISKALHDEENKAKQAGLALTQEQRTEVERLAGIEFDRKNANLEVNELLEKRTALLETLQIAQAAGDQPKVIDTINAISGVEGQLNTAIEKAIQFWQAMGGPGADQAIAKLQNIQAAIGESVKKIEQQFLPSATDINERLADIGGNAFSAFAQAIANGENAVDAFFAALQQGIAEFLIEIGKAIVKQAIFNALSGGAGAGGSGGLGGSIAGWITSIFHEGGIVGSGGARTRMVNPAIFAGAQRFHNGGIPGLGPREVPIIAMDDEEVLTRDDPRHALNGGASGKAVNVKNVNVFDPADVLEAALQNTAGERVILNFLTRNARKVSAALA